MPAYPKDAQLGRRMLPVDEYKVTTKNEDELQKACEEWLAENGFFFKHIPAAAYKAPKAGHALLGIPDLLVFIPIKGAHFNLCILFELKSLKGKARAGQELFARHAHVYQIKSKLAMIDIMGELVRWAGRKELIEQ